MILYITVKSRIFCKLYSLLIPFSFRLFSSSFIFRLFVSLTHSFFERDHNLSQKIMLKIILLLRKFLRTLIWLSCDFTLRHVFFLNYIRSDLILSRHFLSRHRRYRKLNLSPWVRRIPEVRCLIFLTYLVSTVLISKVKTLVTISFESLEYTWLFDFFIFLDGLVTSNHREYENPTLLRDTISSSDP